MAPGLKEFLKRWAVTTVAVLVAAYVVDGIHYDRNNWMALLVATLLLGLLNAFLRPLLWVVSLPLLVLTLGLFTLVINAGLLYLVGRLVKGFHVDSFRAAFWGGLVISVVSIVLNLITGGGRLQVRVQKGQPKAPRRSPPIDKRGGGDDDDGPIIDV
jgi:putative membrane protein